MMTTDEVNIKPDDDFSPDQPIPPRKTITLYSIKRVASNQKKMSLKLHQN